MRSSFPIAGLVVLTLAAAAPAARAQAWDTYSYPDANFAVQFPSQPAVSRGTYRTTAGLDVPAAIYEAGAGPVRYRITLADFTGTAMDKAGAIDDAVKGFGLAGKVAVDVEARINTEYGRELSVAGRDGSWSVTAIFFVKQTLYVLHGRSTLPEPKLASAGLIHFQQSLQFLN